MTIASMHKTLFTKQRKTLLQHLTNAKNGATFLVLAILITYTALPIYVFMTTPNSGHYLELSAISTVAALSILLGSKISIFDDIFQGRTPRLALPANFVVLPIWLLFITFAITAWITAQEIPLLAALAGTDPETISILREQFLKSREGWQTSFKYINAILSGALVPYTIAVMFIIKSPYRWTAFIFFTVFCISFVEKAFFLKATLPLFYLVAQQIIRMTISPTQVLGLMISLLAIVTVLSGAGTSGAATSEPFLSTTYQPEGPIQHLAWRSVAIPLVTAADAIHVFNTEFRGELMWGATSGIISALSGMGRIEFERIVFDAQWGQNKTGTGSANSTYITEAFINFGIIGLILVSIIVGLIMRFFRKSTNEAYKSLWILFAFGVYTSGLLGLLFSNGFILFFALATLIKIKTKSDKTNQASDITPPLPTTRL